MPSIGMNSSPTSTDAASLRTPPDTGMSSLEVPGAAAESDVMSEPEESAAAGVVARHLSRHERPPLVPRPRPDRLPMSYGQERLWFVDRLEGASTEYIMVSARRLRGRLDLAALQRAINTIVERHEILRTRFAVVDGTPVQIIEPFVGIRVAVDDAHGLDEGEQATYVRAALHRENTTPFDLTRGPLLRVRLLRLGEEHFVLLRAMHHIITDAWSQRVFNRELSVLYEAYSTGGANPLPPLPVQYADFAIWQRQLLDESAIDGGLAFWLRHFAGSPKRLMLPADRPHPAVRSYAADTCQLAIPAPQTAALKSFSRSKRSTVYTALLAVYAILLSRYSGQDDIVVGLPVANRQASQLDGVIGFFVNSVPLRVRVQPPAAVGDVLLEVRSLLLEAFEHQDVPIERLTEAMKRTGDLNAAPLYQTVFALQRPRPAASRLGSVLVEAEPRPGQVRVDLEVRAWEWNDCIVTSWLYSTEIFDRWRIEQMARHYLRVLEGVVDDPGQAVADIGLVNAAERTHLLEELNPTWETIDSSDWPDLFTRQAARTPDAVAIVCDRETLTYAAVEEQANRLAHVLIARGVRPDTVVPLALARSAQFVIAVLAVLKAGAAYLPLDMSYPRQRLQFMLRDAAPVCVITANSAPFAVEALSPPGAIAVPQDSCRSHRPSRLAAEAR
jgi:pristinamycin I synthase 3 and 4